MFIEKIKTPGLAHLSYVVGDKGKACVIDPRRDCDIYIEVAKRNNCRIASILETHRNEDLVSGAPILAEMTGAAVHHGSHSDAPVEYASTVVEGDAIECGSFVIEVIETPGHTKDSVSYLLIDQNLNQSAVGIFSGDTLFIGDVGRTDFYPEQAREVAGLLFDSLNKIIHRAPNAILYPAHGAGSVCGDNMADRDFSTVAHEVANNPMLQIRDRESFIEHKVAEDHVVPPYFSRMEYLNSVGGHSSRPPHTIARYEWGEAKKQEGVKIVDVRSEEAFIGAHYPTSYALPLALISGYAGWLFTPEDRMMLVAESHQNAEEAARHFQRIGFDNIEGYVEADLMVSAVKRTGFSKCPGVDVSGVKERLETEANWTLLDVRKPSERRQGYIDGSRHIFLGDLIDQAVSLDKGAAYTTMCASGKRATVAASILRLLGFERVDVFIGSMGAWRAASLPVHKP